ncbi:MAG: hypothetical protein ACRC8N_09505, partial [Aeromonas veronii]
MAIPITHFYTPIISVAREKRDVCQTGTKMALCTPLQSEISAPRLDQLDFIGALGLAQNLIKQRGCGKKVTICPQKGCFRP